MIVLTNDQNVENLVLLIGRLIHQLARFDPNNEVSRKALDYLKRYELIPSVIRGRHMEINEWKQLARKRIESGEMTDDEWSKVLAALLDASEYDGLGAFDDAIGHTRPVAEE